MPKYMPKYEHNLQDLAWALFNGDEKKVRYFYSHMLYHLQKRVGPMVLDRIIDAALEQTDVYRYNKVNETHNRLKKRGM